jgi:hypothetical protein
MKAFFKILKIINKLCVDDDYRREFCFKRFQNRNVKTLRENNLRSLNNTVSHNLTAYEHFAVDFAMQRSKRLIYAVIAHETINYESKILLVGPRTENELFYLKSLGFNFISAIDLISYSEFVSLGDMHSMPFPRPFSRMLCETKAARFTISAVKRS